MLNFLQWRISEMVNILLAQIARPQNWFVLLTGAALLACAVLLLLQSFRNVQGKAGRSERTGRLTDSLTAAAVLGAIGWYLIAREFRLQPQGPGPQLIVDLMTRAALLGGMMLVWLAVTHVFRRQPAVNDADQILTLEQFLEPGETVHWRQRPDPRMFRSETWAAAVFGAILIVPGSTAVVLTTLAFLQEGFVPQLIIPMFAGLVFLSISGYLLGTPARVRRALQSAEYAITDRRVLLLHPVGRSRHGLLPPLRQEFYEYGREQIENRRRERRSGCRTDIILETEFHAARRRPDEIEVGLIGLPNWEAAEQILERQFPQP